MEKSTRRGRKEEEEEKCPRGGAAVEWRSTMTVTAFAVHGEAVSEG